MIFILLGLILLFIFSKKQNFKNPGNRFPDVIKETYSNKSDFKKITINDKINAYSNGFSKKELEEHFPEAIIPIGKMNNQEIVNSNMCPIILEYLKNCKKLDKDLKYKQTEINNLLTPELSKNVEALKNCLIKTDQDKFCGAIHMKDAKP